ncbi:MAG: heme ABC transporter permease [Acidiferrobacterales bacterium]|jgi:heme exporter protein C|nr:heme ABC transporter permease [Gammaproteobacteria bacterium]
MYKYASPKNFYALAGQLIPWLAGLTVLLLAVGLYLGLFVAPPDYQQGESYRIMFIHVPSAWMSLFVYVVMAAAGAAGLAWHTKIAEVLASACAPVGASFTLITLVTGSLWGKPMWGTWWAWDARLTSELILLFLYIGFMALQASIDEPRRAARAAAVLALVGVVNIPIIHFSVEWWNTLHQPASVSKVGTPSIHPSMLVPLLLMALGFKLYFFTVVLMRMRYQILEREKYSHWVAEVLAAEK